MHVQIKDLPAVIQNALASVNFNKKDIEIKVAETIEPRPPSGQGKKGFVSVCNLSTGAHRTTWGSYGGSNMFTKTIDDVQGSVDIPVDGAFILGLGDAGPGFPAMAWIYVHPNNMNQSLLPASADVTEKESKILAIFKGYKSSYRANELQRIGATKAEVDALVERKFLFRNSAGSVTITTMGRNGAAKSLY